jgi:hypothetical protein
MDFSSHKIVKTVVSLMSFYMDIKQADFFKILLKTVKHKTLILNF